MGSGGSDDNIFIFIHKQVRAAELNRKAMTAFKLT